MVLSLIINYILFDLILPKSEMWLIATFSEQRIDVLVGKVLNKSNSDLQQGK